MGRDEAREGLAVGSGRPLGGCPRSRRVVRVLRLRIGRVGLMRAKSACGERVSARDPGLNAQRGA